MERARRRRITAGWLIAVLLEKVSRGGLTLLQSSCTLQLLQPQYSGGGVSRTGFEMTTKRNRMADAGLEELAASSLILADRAQMQLSRIARETDTEACRLSAHSNNRRASFIPSRRGEARILGGPLSLAQRHSACRISMRGGK